MKLYKVIIFILKALSQPNFDDAAIYFENAHKALRPAPQDHPVQATQPPAFAVDKNQQVQRILFEKTAPNPKPLRLQHLTPKFLNDLE